MELMEVEEQVDMEQHGVIFGHSDKSGHDRVSRGTIDIGEEDGDS
jgi:hypothetical protein